MIRLSEEQRAAATALEGPVRIVAGAGTGKTAVIAERYRQLLEAGVGASSILVMTFSERAAAEMRERIVRVAGLDYPPHVGTFHSLALRWLREAGEPAGVAPGFSILTGPERWIRLREAMWDLGDPALIGGERPDDLVTPLLKMRERLKQELVSPARLEAWCRASADAERREYLLAAARLFREHDRRLAQERLLEFDDLLSEAVRLLERRPDLRRQFGARFPWIMVDEYQDTNLAQERIVELLAGGPSANVCVVGDDDQSIYRFRGASRASMERFLRSFPGAQSRTLGRNLRSTANIVAAARSLIDRNPDRIPKPLSALAGAGEPVQVWVCPDGGAEAAAIASEVRRLSGAGLACSQMAVLTRTHAAARLVGEAFDAAGVPWQQRGGQSLYERAEVRDVIAALRLVNDPEDLLALCRLVARPPLGLELEDVLPRLVAAQEAGRSPLVALAGWAPTRNWAGLMLELVARKAVAGVQDLLFELLERWRYLELAAAAGGSEAERVIANVSRFAELVGEYCERRADHSLRRYVEHLDLILLSGWEEETAAPEAAADAVQVMSIHQAKGLEFEAVFLPGLVEGRLPLQRRGQGDRHELPPEILEPAIRGREDQVAEERRLCYVAMTRARRLLYLSWAERYEGVKRWRPSRFLAELAGGEAELGERTIVAVPAPAPAPLTAAAPKRRRSARSAAEPPPLSLSYSAISVYRECPRQYRFRHRLGLPAAQSAEGQLGSLLHMVLLRAGRLVREGRPLTPEVMEALQAEAWAEVEPVDPRRQPALAGLGRRLLAEFLAAGGLARPAHLLEQSFTTNVDNWTLRGIIDRVDPPPTQEGRGAGSNGHGLPGAEWAAGAVADAPPAPAPAAGAWRLVDYKTGAAAPASRLRRDLQLALYALGARQALGLDPVELEIVYLREGRTVRLPATDELIEEARRVGGEVAEAIRAGRFEPRPERRRCQLCAYRLACDAAL